MDPVLLECCRRLIACRSVTNEGTRHIAEMCAGMIGSLSSETKLMPSNREGADQVNMVAKIRGGDSSLAPIVLNTHLDTVPPGVLELWTACDGDPFTASVEGDRIYGLGAADTKLDFAAKLFALRAIGTPHRNLYFVGTFGEEHGLAGAREMVELAALPAGAIAFVGEPSRLEVITAHKGLMVFQLQLDFTPLRVSEQIEAQRLIFAGKAAHSSTPALGVNAIELALQALSINLKLNLAEISGGTAVNVVPARCEVIMASNSALDLPVGGAVEATEFEGPIAKVIPPEVVATAMRFISGLKKYAAEGGGPDPDYAEPTMTCNPGFIRSGFGTLILDFELRPPPGLRLDDVRSGVARVANEVARTAAGISVKVTENRANPGFRAPSGSEAVEMAMAALARAQLPLNAGVKAGCTEAGVYAAAGLRPIVIGPGPSTGVIHAPNEYNLQSEVESAVRFYRALLEM